MMDPREISAMAGQLMPTGSPLQSGAPPQQIQAAAPTPEDLMAMLGPGAMPPGPPPPAGPPDGGDQGPPKKPAPDLVPPGLKEEIAKYAATQQVKMSRQLLALAGPASSDVPAGKGLLLDLWNKRNADISDEQIAAWQAEGKKPGWVLAQVWPGRYALMGMGHWRPKDKVAFAQKMARLAAGEDADPPGQSYDPASLETVADEDPTPGLSLS